MEEIKKSTPAVTEVDEKNETKDYYTESIALLHKQMRLLSKVSQSVKPEQLAELSSAMVNIHKTIWQGNC